jgi:hypothetical protein
VRTLLAMDRVAVAPLGEDCQVFMSSTSPPIRVFPHPTSDVLGSGLPISAGEHSRTFIQHRRFVRCGCVAQGQARCTLMTVKVVLYSCTLPCIFSFMLFKKCVCGNKKTPKAGLEPATILRGGRIRPYSLTDAFHTWGKTQEKSRWDSNPRSSAPETDALSTRPLDQPQGWTRTSDDSTGRAD